VHPSVGTAASHRRTRATIALATLAVACAIGGCHESGADPALAQNADCSVIARFVTEPDGALLADLERTNAVEIEPLGAITDDLRMYRLHVVGADDDCMAVIERLRRDTRVRSIELDRRRELHEERLNAQEEG
jgi:hypothetical protein